MLSKEEIENLLKDISRGFRKIPQVENILYPLDINQFQKLSEYIEQLESNNKKLIEKLEKDINQITSSKTYDYAGTEWQESWVVEELQEILEIAKGEKE